MSSFCLLDYINKGDGGFRHPQIILVSLAFPFATAWAVVAVVVRTHVAQAQACLEAPVLAQHPLVAVGKARAMREVTDADLIAGKYLLVQRGKKNYYLVIAE